MIPGEFDARAKATLGLGLGLTDASVGRLVGGPPRPPRIHPAAYGLLVGVGCSVPGAVFMAVPHPLQEDAPRCWRKFAAGVHPDPALRRSGFIAAIARLASFLPAPNKKHRQPATLRAVSGKPGISATPPN